MKFAAVLLLGFLPLLAQNSGFQGIVSDPSGAPVPDTVVKVVNVGTGAVTTVRSNEQGFYTAPLLPVGDYKIEAQKTGFAPVSVENLKLDVGQVARIDLALKIGAVAETIEVTAAAALLESETTNMGQVIENKRIVEMPLNLRNYLELAKTAAGVLSAQQLGRGARTAGEDGQEGGFIGLGQRAFQTNVLLDGIDNSSRASGGPLGFQAQAVKPPVDLVAEFKVVTNNNSAEYGYRMGPKVLVSTKSGTNNLHGSLYEFLRNERLDGTNFFANRSGSKKPTLRQNQFGGTVGGPVIRNRTFYFFSYQGARIRRGMSFTSTVPGALARSGNFSQEGRNRDRIFDPLTTTGTGAAAIRQAFPNNVIPRARWDSITSQIIPNYPLPNIAGRENTTNNYFFAPSDMQTDNQYDIKIDHNFTDADRTFFRWSIRRDTKLQNGPLPREANGGGLGQTVILPSDNWMGSWTRSVRPTIFNELRFGFTHYPTLFDILDKENLNKKYGIKNVPGDTFNDGMDHGLARFSPNSYNEIGSRSFWPNRNFLDNLQINDNLLIQRGSHSIKTGVEFRRADIFREAQRLRRGLFTFSKVFTAEKPNDAASRSATGNGLADMLLGYAASTQVGNQLSEDAIAPYWGLYVQDDWKLSSTVTLNIGLRWEWFVNPYFPQGVKVGRMGVSRYITEFNVARTDPRYETFERPKNGRDSGGNEDLNNFAPRLGIAWRATPKTVVRTGVGIFYGEADYITSESARFINQTPDFTQVTTNSDNITPAAIVSNGFPLVVLPATAPVAGTTVECSLDDFPSQYSSQWFLDVQRQMPGDILFAFGYQGAKSTHLYTGRDINNPGPHVSIPASQRRVRPKWNAVTLRDNGSNSNYQAFFMRAEKRFSKGLTFLSSYTWSHNIDQSEESLDQNLSGVANPYDYTNERGNASLDRRHNWITSFTYELPTGNLRGVARTLLGGWQVGGILTLMTGTPFDISYPGDTQNTGTRNRGNRVGSGKIDNPTIDRWFDEFAFVAAAPGVYGNTGRNVLYGPGSRNFDFVLGKRFPINERHAIQFRFESFNFTNTPRFGLPASGLR
ncbi:MAG: carboxypeptidase regulatory-like domain-containing protein, partial [Bryobacteraceae bacterium]